jgi:hypothetical protein
MLIIESLETGLLAGFVDSRPASSSILCSHTGRLVGVSELNRWPNNWGLVRIAKHRIRGPMPRQPFRIFSTKVFSIIQSGRCLKGSGRVSRTGDLTMALVTNRRRCFGFTSQPQLRVTPYISLRPTMSRVSRPRADS